MYALNLSHETGRRVVCREQSFDAKEFKLFVECRGKEKGEWVTVMVNVERDANKIVNSLLYIREYVLESGSALAACENVKILYAN